jgi:hypothetical protein
MTKYKFLYNWESRRKSWNYLKNLQNNPKPNNLKHSLNYYDVKDAKARNTIITHNITNVQENYVLIAGHIILRIRNIPSTNAKYINNGLVSMVTEF